MKLLHFLILTPIFLSSLANSLTHPKDIQALQNFKSQFDPDSIGSGSCLSSWDFSLDPCDHLFSTHFTCGIRCDFILSGLGRVTEIALDSAGYSGSLSSSSVHLPFLHTLDLSGNSLSGSVPDSLATLTRLRRLSLSKNSFSNPIPNSLGSLPLLEELYLDDNQLTGSIPPSFNKLGHLTRLEIQRNQLSGEFPFLGSLKNLLFLDATDNFINSIGTNPLSLPLSLVSLSIRNNSLVGEIPRNFLHMKVLEVLDLSYNQLIGSLTGEIFQHPSLQQLSLSHNRLASLESPSGNRTRASKMVAIDLSYNVINGLLPKFVVNLQSLSALSLEYNRFTGMIPPNYAVKVQTTSFQRLLLGGNYLFGPIPGALKRIKPGSVNLSLVDNCFYTCPDSFFFCKGGVQKSLLVCKGFRPRVP